MCRARGAFGSMMVRVRERRPSAPMSDEQVPFGGGAVGEHCPHARWRGLGVVQTPAVLNADAAPHSLVVQLLVQVGPRHRAGRHGDRGQLLAAADELHRRCVHAEIADRVLQIEDVESFQPVDGQGQERADAVRAATVRLKDDRVDARSLERHCGHRARDTPADDQCFFGHSHTIHIMTIALPAPIGSHNVSASPIGARYGRAVDAHRGADARVPDAAVDQGTAQG